MLSQDKQSQSLTPVLFCQEQEERSRGKSLPPLLASQEPAYNRDYTIKTLSGPLFSRTYQRQSRSLYRNSVYVPEDDRSSSSGSKFDSGQGSFLTHYTRQFLGDSAKPDQSTPRSQDLSYSNRTLTFLSGSLFNNSRQETGSLFSPRQYSHDSQQGKTKETKSVRTTATSHGSCKLDSLSETQLKSLSGALFSLISSVACPSAALGSAPAALTMSTSQHLKIHYGTSNMRCIRADRGRDRYDTQPHPPKLTMHSNKEPTFYIGGGNGVALINDAMEEIGWRRIKEKTDDNVKLRWCELKTAINYGTFKEGEQMVNHIPNCHLLTNKMGLLNSLTEYEKLLQSNSKRGRVTGRVKLADFIPETYKLDDAKDRESFFSVFKEGEWWICKPTGRNQGKGIFITTDVNEIKQLVQEHDGEPGRPSKPINRVIQRYIKNPLLLDKKKFDIRAYMLIANMTPYLVLYHKGYVRLSLNEYDNDSGNLITHLTNQFIQKKDPLYKENKEDTAWSMDRFNDYINEHVAAMKGLPDDWVFSVLEKRMRECMLYSFNAVKNKLQAKCGFFDLYGYDFMVDEDMKIYLIEVNINPCLATNCEALRDVVPGMVKEALYISIECFEKARKNKPLLPLQTLNSFEIIFNGSKAVAAKQEKSKSPIRSTNGKSKTDSPPQSLSASPQRRPKSLSPVKESKMTATDDANSAVNENSDKKTDKEKTDAKNAKKTEKTDANEGSPKQSIKRVWLPKATVISVGQPGQSNSRSIRSGVAGGSTRRSAPNGLTSSESNIDSSSPYASKLGEANIRLRMSHSSTGLTSVKRSKSKGRMRKDDDANDTKAIILDVMKEQNKQVAETEPKEMDNLSKKDRRNKKSNDQEKEIPNRGS